LLYCSLKEKNAAQLHQRGKSNEEDSSENRRKAKNAQKRNNPSRIKGISLQERIFKSFFQGNAGEEALSTKAYE
jgi:hypothetical protein